MALPLQEFTEFGLSQLVVTVPHSPQPFINIQHKSWYSFYYLMEDRRLSWPGSCLMVIHPWFTCPQTIQVLTDFAQRNSIDWGQCVTTTPQGTIWPDLPIMARCRISQNWVQKSANSEQWELTTCIKEYGRSGGAGTHIHATSSSAPLINTSEAYQLLRYQTARLQSRQSAPWSDRSYRRVKWNRPNVWGKPLHHSQY